MVSCITRIWCAIQRPPCRASCSRSGLISIRDSSIGPGPKHEVAGNHIRFDARSELVLDESWRQSLSPLKQRAIELGTLLSRQTLPKTGAVR